MKRERGSQKVHSHPEKPNFVFAFHDRDEIEPRMLARIAKHTELAPEDIR